MSLAERLKERNLPPLKSREEMKEILFREVYGYLPQVDYSWSVSEPELVEKRYGAGEVEHTIVTLTITAGNKSHSFEIDRLMHKDGKKRPLVLFNNFHRMGHSQYFATEEMSEYDANFFLFCYKEISSDTDDFEDGLAPLLLPNGRDSDTACGKIPIWAWGAMRVLDYALTLDSTDEKNIAIAGHSRLGKTALFTAMCDERISFAYSNNAGCGGDAINRGNTGLLTDKSNPIRGETIFDSIKMFPFWYCENYKKYTQKGYADDFDQHFLTASIAPRCVMIGSNLKDYWADPASQLLCALAASPAWENLGEKGLLGATENAIAPYGLIDGKVGFFAIDYPHFMSRHGWKYFMQFMQKHKN